MSSSESASSRGRVRGSTDLDENEGGGAAPKVKVLSVFWRYMRSLPSFDVGVTTFG